MNDPKTYLSASGGKFRVIHQAMPLSADKSTASEALAVAESYRLTVDLDRMWDGDSGDWMPRGLAVRLDNLRAMVGK